MLFITGADGLARQESERERKRENEKWRKREETRFYIACDVV